jgi:hypothetical protein
MRSEHGIFTLHLTVTGSIQWKTNKGTISRFTLTPTADVATTSFDRDLGDVPAASAGSG